jgi:glycosyltransferase involved in cell wall biosynthesis
VPDRAPGSPARPRLLFLCQTLPFPPDGGVSIRTFHVLRLLARRYEVTALCFYRRKERGTPERVAAGVAGLREVVAAAEAFPIPQEHSRLRLAADHLRSLAAGRAYTLYAYDSAACRARLRALLRGGRFDLTHVDSLDLAGYLPLLDGHPEVCVHHNLESGLLRRRAARARGPVRAYLRRQAALVERLERHWCPRVSLNVAVSEADREGLGRLAPGARIAVVPNGVDTGSIRPGEGTGEGIVFVGAANWFPNRDGFAWLCDEVLPRLRARGIDPAVRWVGRAPEALRRELRGRHGVELTGYVDDVRPYLQGAACYVVPLRVGGGTRLKVLDAWAAGMAVVGTSLGCEGLDARHGENVLLADTPGAFADAVEAVLHDGGLRARLGASARRTAEETYDWEVLGERMLAEYDAVLARTRGRPPADAPSASAA